MRKRKSTDIHVRVLDTTTGEVAEATASNVSAALIKAQKRLKAPSIWDDPDFSHARPKPKRKNGPSPNEGVAPQQ